MSKPKTRGAKFEWEIDVEFGGVGQRKKCHSLGFGFASDSMDAAAAVDNLVNAQLTVELVCDPNAKKDAEGQTTMEHAEVTQKATVNSAGIHFGENGVRGSLQFNRDAVPISDLCRFGFQAGKLRFTKVGAAVKDDDGAKPAEEDADDSGDETENVKLSGREFGEMSRASRKAAQG